MKSIPAADRLDRWRLWTCVALLIIAAGYVAVGIVSMPGYYQRVVSRTVPTITSTLTTETSNFEIAARASARGMSLETYAIYEIGLNLVTTLIFVGVALLIVIKAKGKWFSWFTAFILVFVPNGSLYQFAQVSQILNGYLGIGSIFWPLFLVYLYLFPTGIAAPRWTRWVMAGIVCIHFFIQAMSVTDQLFGWTLISRETLERIAGIVLLGFPFILVCQIYRYLRVSTKTERLQTQWVVAGLALNLLLSLPLSTSADSKIIGDNGLRGDLDQALLIILPITIGISILKYKLFDIDWIIRKTLVYAALTVSLGLVYFGSVVLFQEIIRTFAGQAGRSPVAIVLSTLMTAALFSTLRRRVQNLIDRSFFRKRFDAERTVHAFAAAMRDEVDLNQMSDRLVEVVNETMQPESVTLWLRANEKPGQ